VNQDDLFVTPSQYQTAHIPGIGGEIKVRPEDFLVEEIPLYQPSGAGEHLYLFLQKRSLSTFEMLNIVADHFGVSKREIGFAGLKDKQAITRQVVSVHLPGRKFEEIPSFEHEKISVLWADMHANKLRRGHLAGNRFSIRVRGVKPTDVIHAGRILEHLARTGVANRLGRQRFGLLENNHLIGRLMINSDHQAAVRELLGPSALHPEVNREARAAYAEGRYEDAMGLLPRSAFAERTILRLLSRGSSIKRAFFAVDFTILGFYISAFQSAVFNRVADERVQAGTLDTLEPGDLAIKHANHAVFAVDQSLADDPSTIERLRTLEISPSGPMWGADMKRSQGAVDQREVEALKACGVSVEQLLDFAAKSRNLIAGERRPLRVPVVAPEYEGGMDEHGPYVRCAFELPKGSFATVVMEEIMKNGATGQLVEHHTEEES
jgi:tRNA pseudouridine13 synthase